MLPFMIGAATLILAWWSLRDLKRGRTAVVRDFLLRPTYATRRHNPVLFWAGVGTRLLLIALLVVSLIRELAALSHR